MKGGQGNNLSALMALDFLFTAETGSAAGRRRSPAAFPPLPGPAPLIDSQPLRGDLIVHSAPGRHRDKTSRRASGASPPLCGTGYASAHPRERGARARHSSAPRTHGAEA